MLAILEMDDPVEAARLVLSKHATGLQPVAGGRWRHAEGLFTDGPARSRHDAPILQHFQGGDRSNDGRLDRNHDKYARSVASIAQFPKPKHV